MDQSFKSAHSELNNKLVSLQIARTSDWSELYVQSHLGFHLKEGDLCLGYDLEKLNLEETDNL
jgi:hypothetical protein